MSKVAFLFFLFCNTIAVYKSHAQEFSYTLFDRSRGFNRNYVNDIARDPFGFYWLGTDRGIMRFDGNNLTEFPDPAAAVGNTLLIRINGHLLYLVYETEGIAVANIKTGKFFKLTKRRAADMVVYSNGDHLIYYADGTLIRYSNSKAVDSVQLYPDHTALLRPFKGKIYAKIQGHGIIPVDSAIFSAGNEINVPYLGISTRFAKAEKLLFYYLNGQALNIDSDSKIFPASISPAGKNGKVDELNILSSGRKIWIQDDRELLFADDDETYRLNLPGKKLYEFRTLFVENPSQGIVGLSGGFIIYRLSTSNGQSFNNDQSAVPDVFRVRRKIIPMGIDHEILLGNPGFLIRIKGEINVAPYRNEISTYDGIRLGNFVYATTESDTLYRFDPEKNRIIKLTLADQDNSEKLYCLATDSLNNSLVIGAAGNVFRYNPSTQKVSKHAILGNSSARAIKRQPGSNHWWIGTTDGLYELDEHLKLIRKFSGSSKQIKGSTVSDLFFAGNDQLWLSHDRGAELLDIRIGRITDSIPQTEFNDSRVTAILPDQFNRLWLSTYDGLLCYNLKTREIIRLGTENGLLNSEFNYKAAVLLPDGRLMFGGLNGYDLIDPAQYTPGATGGNGIISGYQLVAENGVVKNFPLQINPTELRFDTEKEFIRIFLSTDRAIDAASNRYQFRLDGGAWNDLQGKAALEIYKLSPGTYRLEFRGFTQNGGTISFPAINLRSEIVFYKSAPFLLGASLMILLLSLFVLFLIRRARIREREIRDGISMDLHDEVGTILTKALIASRSGDYKKETRVEDYLREGLHSLRLYINTMSRQELRLGKLVAEVRELFLHDSDPVKLVFEGPSENNHESNLLLPAGLYRDIKLCIFELVTNCQKHSRAGKMEIRLSVQDGFIFLEYNDDGELNDITNIENKGSGIRNLRRRCEKNKGKAEFSIGSDRHGLNIKLRFRI